MVKFDQKFSQQALATFSCPEKSERKKVTDNTNGKSIYGNIVVELDCLPRVMFQRFFECTIHFAGVLINILINVG